MAIFREREVVCPDCGHVRKVKANLDDKEIKTKYYWKENECQVVSYLICTQCKEKREEDEEDEFAQRFIQQHKTNPEEAIEMLAREVYQLRKTLKGHLKDHPQREVRFGS